MNILEQIWFHLLIAGYLFIVAAAFFIWKAHRPQNFGKAQNMRNFYWATGLTIVGMATMVIGAIST